MVGFGIDFYIYFVYLVGINNCYYYLVFVVIFYKIVNIDLCRIWCFFIVVYFRDVKVKYIYEY